LIDLGQVLPESRDCSRNIAAVTTSAISFRPAHLSHRYKLIAGCLVARAPLSCLRLINSSSASDGDLYFAPATTCYASCRLLFWGWKSKRSQWQRGQQPEPASPSSAHNARLVGVLGKRLARYGLTLRDFLDQRVTDGVIRRMIDKWLKAGARSWARPSFVHHATIPTLCPNKAH
jgi:hypothetical protein